MSPTSLRKTARGRPPLRALALSAVLLLLAQAAPAAAQAIGSHRGDVVGSAGGRHTLQGRVISPLGKLPDSRVRVTLEHANIGSRSAVVGEDGSFFFNNLEGGSYRVTVDAGKDYEVAREAVFIDPGKPIFTLPVYLRLKPEANPALAGVPKPALELFDNALEAGRENENEKAAALLGQAIALHPDFGLAHNELGLLHLKTGQLDKAVEEFRAALKSLPDDAQIQTNYAMALLEKKEFGEAEKHLRKAVKKMDKSPQVHMYLGVALMRQKAADEAARQRALEEAQREFQQSIKLGGDPAGRVHYYLGGVYWARRDFKKAADELEAYLKRSPKAPDAEQVRATIKDLRGKS